MTGLPLLAPAVLNRAARPHIERINCNHAPGILDLGKCRTPADMAPRLIVPCKAIAGVGVSLGHDYRHLHVDFRDYHYCQRHTGELRIDAVLIPRLKGQIEAAAKAKRPHDFKCDFDAAHLVYVSVFTPEYEYFELVKHLMPRAQLEQAWGAVVGS